MYGEWLKRWNIGFKLVRDGRIMRRKSVDGLGDNGGISK